MQSETNINQPSEMGRQSPASGLLPMPPAPPAQLQLQTNTNHNSQQLPVAFGGTHQLPQAPLVAMQHQPSQLPHTPPQQPLVHPGVAQPVTPPRKVAGDVLDAGQQPSAPSTANGTPNRPRRSLGTPISLEAVHDHFRQQQQRQNSVPQSGTPITHQPPSATPDNKKVGTPVASRPSLQLNRDFIQAGPAPAMLPVPAQQQTSLRQPVYHDEPNPLRYPVRNSRPRELFVINAAAAAASSCGGSVSEGQAVSRSASGQQFQSSISTIGASPTMALPTDTVQDVELLVRNGASTIMWQKGRHLGTGGQGQVYAGLDENGHLLAGKIIDPGPRVGPSSVRALTKEVRMCQQLHHPNIVQYLCCGKSSKGEIIILMEYVPGGSLRGYYLEFGPLSESLVALFTRQLLRGTEYLHANGVVHRDIKAANILVTCDGRVKIADFGAAEHIRRVAERTTGAGTAHWMAPELFKGHPCSYASDVWSIGSTVLELLVGQIPFRELFPSRELYVDFQTSNTQPMPLPENLNPIVRDFISRCLVLEPEDRPSVSDLLQHPFVAHSIQIDGADEGITGGDQVADGHGGLMKVASTKSISDASVRTSASSNSGTAQQLQSRAPMLFVNEDGYAGNGAGSCGTSGLRSLRVTELRSLLKHNLARAGLDPVTIDDAVGNNRNEIVPISQQEALLAMLAQLQSRPPGDDADQFEVEVLNEEEEQEVHSRTVKWGVAATLLSTVIIAVVLAFVVFN